MIAPVSYFLKFFNFPFSLIKLLALPDETTKTLPGMIFSSISCSPISKEINLTFSVSMAIFSSETLLKGSKFKI